MPLHAFTARIGVRDPDVLDITVKSAGPVGKPFAPSWAIVAPVIELRRVDASTEEIERAWSTYVTAFSDEMRCSYREHRAAWDALLRRERVVLSCYCVDHSRCHRTLLARDVLPRLGAVYAGELASTPAQKGLF